MRFLNFPLIQLCLAFGVGVYLGFLGLFNLTTLLIMAAGMCILMVFFYSKFSLRPAFFNLSLILFACLGTLNTYIHLPSSQPGHISHLVIENNEVVTVNAEVSEILRPSEDFHKYILNSIHIDNKSCNGKILWYISKKADSASLRIGDKVIIPAQLQDFQESKNPQSFDYVRFMKNRDVYKVMYEDHFIKPGEKGVSSSYVAANYRSKIINSLRESGFEKNHIEFMQALILGQKQAIDRETYNTFTEVGIVHILAVSGLHVGILLLIIQFLLKPLLYLRSYGKPFSVLLSILGLWCFAALVGFSPSVLRATTMFTFLALGQLKSRKTNSINMLMLSAMFLLLWNPQILFEVGFQLSYAAVFAIVMLYPVFSKFYLPKHKLSQLIVNTAYVSLAAQIGVLPFQLFYFHQFPSLFLVANIVVIPFLGILLAGGIICMVLSLLGILFDPILQVYAFFIDSLLKFVEQLSRYKVFLIQDIFFTKPMFITFLLMIFCLIIMLKSFKARSISVFLISALGFSLFSITEISKVNQTSEMVIFHKSKASIVGYKVKNDLSIYADSTEISNDDYWLKNYRLLNNIKNTYLNPTANVFTIKGKRLLRIDSTSVYPKDFKSDLILLSGSPDVHLEKLILQNRPELIITDGNNYKSYVEKWKSTAKKHNISFHNTFEKGYIRFNLN